MRTGREILEALIHLNGALSACPEEEHEGETYISACKMYVALSWVMKLDAGNSFAAMIDGFKDVDAAFGRSIQ